MVGMEAGREWGWWGLDSAEECRGKGNLNPAGRELWVGKRRWREGSLSMLEGKEILGTYRNSTPYTSLDEWSQPTAVWVRNQTHNVVIWCGNGERERERDPSLLGPNFIWGDIDWEAGEVAQQMIGQIKPFARNDPSFNVVGLRGNNAEIKATPSREKDRRTE